MTEPSNTLQTIAAAYAAEKSRADAFRLKYHERGTRIAELEAELAAARQDLRRAAAGGARVRAAIRQAQDVLRSVDARATDG